MRLTIIRDDGVVGIDGVFRRVSLDALPGGIRVVQWEGTTGEIEYDEGANEDLTGILGFQPFIDLWTAAGGPQIPTKVTMRQARLALFQIGYLDQVDTFLAGMEGDDGIKARIDWQFAPFVERTYPLVAAMAGIISLDSEQLDDLFLLAASL